MGIRRMKYHLRQECRFWVSRKAVWDALKVIDMEGLLARREHRLERRIFHAVGRLMATIRLRDGVFRFTDATMSSRVI